MFSRSIILLCILLGFATGCTKQPNRDSDRRSRDTGPARRETGRESHVSVAAGTSIAFVRGGIWIAGADGNSQREIADGSDPEISPDGRRVAFTLLGKDGQRSIAIVDTGGGMPAVLTAIPGDNNYGPRWSPDGLRLLFLHYQDGAWLPGIVEADNSACRILGEGNRSTGGFHSPCWASNGLLVYCQDLRFLYEMDLKGSVRSATDVSILLGRYRDSVSISSASRFACLPGGNAIVFDADVDAYAPAGAGAIFLLDMANRTVLRLTPPELSASGPSVAGDDIYFSGFELTKENKSRMLADRPVRTAIFRMSSADRRPRILIHDAGEPSVSSR